MLRGSAVSRRSSRIALAAFLVAFTVLGIFPPSVGNARFGAAEAWALGDPDDGNGRQKMPDDIGGGGAIRPPAGVLRPLKPIEVARLLLAQSRVLVWMLVRIGY